MRTYRPPTSAPRPLRSRASASTARPLLASCAILALLAFPSTAQTLSPGEVRISSHPYWLESRVLRTQSRQVQVEVVVRDSSGHAVAGLTKGDFAIFDSGHPRDLSEFSVEETNAASPAAEVPAASPVVGGNPGAAKQVPGPSRWIELFFDDINTPSGDLTRAKIAARRFISEATRSGDRIGVFTASQGQVLPFTADTSAVLNFTATVESHHRMSAEGLSACPRITPYEAYLIVSNDPATTQAKLIEACNCPGQSEYSGCQTDDTTLTNVTPVGIQQLPQNLRSLLGSVVAQARATWNQTHLVTQATLNAVQEAIERLAPASGARILLFASSGFLSGDLGQEEHKLIDEALRANVAIDSLDSKGLYAEQPGGPQGEPSSVSSGPGSELTMMHEMQELGEKLDSEDYAMADFALGTGGLLFRNSNDIDYGFRELGLAPAYAYVLGFPPDEDGKYHKIKVELKNPSHNFIQARPGYFAPTKETKDANRATPKNGIDAQMSGANERSDFPLSVSAKPTSNAKGDREISVETHVEIVALPFENEKDRHDEKLTFVAGLFDAQGKFVVGKEADMQFAFKQESFDRFSKSGITGTMSLEAPPGSYQLRVVVEEGVKGEMSATSQTIRIPQD